MNNPEFVAVTCIDYRVQSPINDWLKTQALHDRVSLAGGIKDLSSVLTQIGLSYQLHHINRAILINHEDCGMYQHFSHPEEQSIADLQNAAKIIAQTYPIKPEIYFAQLNGIIRPIWAQ